MLQLLPCLNSADKLFIRQLFRCCLYFRTRMLRWKHFGVKKNESSRRSLMFWKNHFKWVVKEMESWRQEKTNMTNSIEEASWSLESRILAVRWEEARTPQVRSRKPNQMANRTLNLEAGNGNWWGPRNYERKLLIGPEHIFHWLNKRTSCSLVGKYGWKAVRNHAIWFVFW